MRIQFIQTLLSFRLHVLHLSVCAARLTYNASRLLYLHGLRGIHYLRVFRRDKHSTNQRRTLLTQQQVSTCHHISSSLT